MNKYYMVEVDDYFPIEILTGKSILPVETDRSYIWPLIIAKALLKFFNSTFQKFIDDDYMMRNEAELFNGDIIYALSGMYTFSIDLASSLDFDWNYLSMISSNDNYFSNSFKLSTIKVFNPLKNPIDNLLNLKSLALDNEFGHHQGGKRNMNYKNHNEFVKRIMENNKKEIVNIKSGMLFTVDELFENGNFNMQYVKKISEEEIILRKRYAKMLKTKTQFMNKEDIIKMKKSRRDLRMRIKDLENHTKERLSKNSNTVKLMSIFSGLFKEKKFNLKTKYNHKEVKIAQTCIMNNLEAPPNYHSFNDMKLEEGSVISGSLNSNFFKTIEEALSSKLKSLSDFSMIENIKKPQTRNVSTWIDILNYFNNFNFLNIHYNPKIFQHNETIEKSENPYICSIDPAKQVLVVYREESENKETSFFVNFQIDSCMFRSALILQKYDFEKFCAIKNFPTIKNSNSGMKVPISDENQVYRISLYSKRKTIISFLSKSYFEIMSVSNYLKNVEFWQEKQFKIKTTDYIKNSTRILSKFYIRTDKKQNIIFSCNYDQYIANNTVFRIFKADDLPKQNEGDFSFLCNNMVSKDFFVETYNNIELDVGEYIIVTECLFSENIKEFEFDLFIFNKFTLILKQLDLFETDFYQEQLSLKNDGNITRELLFFDSKEANLSLQFNIMRGEEQEETKDKKGGKTKDIDIAKFKNLDSHFYVYIDFYRNNDKLYTFSGIKTCNIINLNIEKRKLEDEISIRVRTAPKNIPELNDEEIKKQLFWFIKIKSDKNIAIVQDKRLEEQDNNMIASWEENDPNRAERAKQIREENIKKYLNNDNWNKSEKIDFNLETAIEQEKCGNQRLKYFYKILNEPIFKRINEQNNYETLDDNYFKECKRKAEEKVG